jgi:CrcB protein
MNSILLVFLGGGVGSVARYLVGVNALRLLGTRWPYGTFTVNVVGGLIMGLLSGWLLLRGGPDQDRWRVLFGVGVLGGFTTFSSFSLEVASLMKKGDLTQATAYVAASVVLAIGAVFLGQLVAHRLWA